jgi:peptidoglycan/xylan/chitin deacetylase (PgdA/CDA1 family)
MQKNRKHNVILTVDTEFSTHKGLMGVWGNIGKCQYGIPKLIEIFNKHRIKATFFIDVYQKESEIRRAGEFILKHGHDLQLHTHPGWKYGRKRENMNYYNFDEQCEIIHYGKACLKSWFGSVPVSHRSGDFALNPMTLSALQENHIFSDFSYFYQWPDCQLNQMIDLKNKVVQFDKVYEIPVTCFYSPGMKISHSYRLIDINEPYPLLINLFQLLKKLNFKTIIIVLHSFSLIGCNEFHSGSLGPREAYWPLGNNIKKLERLLHFLKNDNSFCFRTVKEYFALLKTGIDGVTNPDLVPRINIVYTLHRLCTHGCSAFYDRLFRIRRFG